jgi:S1-C subfamily serine protease
MQTNSFAQIKAEAEKGDVVSQFNRSNNFTSPENQTATGTGFFITDDGYLISNYHVVKDADESSFAHGRGND